jgi:hypothetical protein
MINLKRQIQNLTSPEQWTSPARGVKSHGGTTVRVMVKWGG